MNDVSAVLTGSRVEESKPFLNGTPINELEKKRNGGANAELKIGHLD